MNLGEVALTVLVADDSSVFRKHVEHSLSGKNYNLVFASNGRETLELFERHDPHIVILDWAMPDTTGGEICRHIRRIKKSAYTYIVIVTANQTSELRVEGLACGADDYITKPFDGEELLARAFQHEIDHLDGILFIFRVSALKRDLIQRRIRKLQKAGEW